MMIFACYIQIIFFRKKKKKLVVGDEAYDGPLAAQLRLVVKIVSVWEITL
jgi:hypothetical protein